MTRRGIVRLAGLLVLLGIGLALLFVFRPAGKEDAGPLPTGEISASAEAQELATLIKKGDELTIHAVYKTVGPVVPTGGSSQIEVWRKDGLARIDTVVRTLDDKELRQSSFQLQDRVIVCGRQDDDPWRCTGAPNPSPNPSGGDDPFLGSVVSELAGKTVKVKSEEVLGRDARCFTISDATQTAKYCITRDGLPVLIDASSARQELIELEEEVGDDVFDPPAEPSEPG